jgi:SSS family solute:Na+ symporter
LIFSVFAAPFWAVFLLGMLTRRTNEHGAILGFLLGSSFSFAHSVAVSREWLHYGSTMTANFHSAAYAFTIAATAAWLLSPRGSVTMAGRLQWSIVTVSRTNTYLVLLALLLLIACVWFNFWWF